MVSYVNIFFWMLLLGIFVLIGSTKKDVCGQFGFMSKDTTNALRGAASLLIMSQHIGGKLGTAVLTPLGGIGVAIFLICSGYGLNESYVQNRNIKSKHLKQYWLKKIWKVFLPYAGVEALFFFLLSDTERYQRLTAADYFLDLSCIRPVYWYLQEILLCYVIFFFCILTPKLYRYKYLILGGTSVLMFLVSPGLMSEQAFAFLIGVAISDQKEKARQFLTKKSVLGVIFCVSTGALLVKQLPMVRVWSDTWLYTFLQILIKTLMALVMIGGAGRVKNSMNNAFLGFMGKISYEIYLIHYGILLLFDLKQSVVLQMLFFLISSIFLAWCYHSLWKILRRSIRV